MRLLILVMLVGLNSWAFASAGGVSLDKANIEADDREAIKRGATLFVSYCLNCHSAAFMRYARIAEDTGMNSDEIGQLIHTGAKVGDTMKVAIEPDDAERWFGVSPPDLSVVSRSRGVDWLYTYLRSFYRDSSRPWGVNNTVFQDVAMPHVLWELQGLQEPVREEGADLGVVTGLRLAEPGKLSPEEYDEVVRDLVSFMAYLGEPSKMQRLALGKWVLLFLSVLLVLVVLLKKEYWKDIH